MKILITGSNGQVGRALVKQLINHNLVPISRDHCDFIKDTISNKIWKIITIKSWNELDRKYKT